MSVDHEKNSAEVHGKVEYRDPQLVITRRCRFASGGEAEFEGAQFELPLQPARGEARSLPLNREGVLSLEGVSYTTCPIDQQDWRIRADSVSLNTKTRMGTAHDARVDFLGLTVLRLPVITFPVGDARKSGFLFPTIGNTSRGGVQLSAPYYFNLAPNYDLTVTPTDLQQARPRPGWPVPLPDASRARDCSAATCCRRTTTTATRAAASRCWTAPSCRVTGD